MCVLHDCKVNVFKLGFSSLSVFPLNKHNGDPSYDERAPVFATFGGKPRITTEDAEKLGEDSAEQDDMMDARFRSPWSPETLRKDEKKS